MSRNPLLIDAGLAIACAVVVIVVSPGLAVTAIVALAVLALCGLTLVFDLRRR